MSHCVGSWKRTFSTPSLHLPVEFGRGIREGVIGEDKALATFTQFVAENPYKGTAEQVVTLSLGIAAAGARLSRATFAIYRDQSGIGEKVFSKLKVIGERLGGMNDKTRREVVKALPPSYSAIHALCALKPEELTTAVKNQHVTPKTSYREASEYVRTIRFPHKAQKTQEAVEKGRWSIKETAVFKVCLPQGKTLSDEAQALMQEELRRVASRYECEVRHAVEDTTTSLLEANRREKASFWRGVLESELPQTWFRKTDQDIRKQFNLKVVEEVWDAPLRSFTGFLIRTGGGKDKFYEEHGRAYVAKLHYVQFTTENRSNRHVTKRRIEEVLGHEKAKELAIWRNVILKQGGFI